MKTIKIKLVFLLMGLAVLPLHLHAAVDERYVDEMCVDASFTDKAVQHAGKKRNYYDAPTANDKKDLRYIMRTLANNSLLKISWNASSLKKAGERIDHLHPFKFLEAIFCDHEMRAHTRHLQGKARVWKEFVDGVSDSLTRENTTNNLTPHMQEFATQVAVDAQIIQPLVSAKKWKELINALIVHTPR
jgi:hypothetical protein